MCGGIDIRAAYSHSFICSSYLFLYWILLVGMVWFTIYIHITPMNHHIVTHICKQNTSKFHRSHGGYYGKIEKF